MFVPEDPVSRVAHDTRQLQLTQFESFPLVREETVRLASELSDSADWFTDLLSAATTLFSLGASDRSPTLLDELCSTETDGACSSFRAYAMSLLRADTDNIYKKVDSLMDEEGKHFDSNEIAARNFVANVARAVLEKKEASIADAEGTDSDVEAAETKELIDAVVAAVPEDATLEPEAVRAECTQLAALSEGKLRTNIQAVAAQLEDADDGSAQHTYLHKKLELGTEMFKRRPAVARLLSMWQTEALEKHSISDTLRQLSSADKLLKSMLASDDSLNEELIKVEKQQDSSPDNEVLAWQIKVIRRCIGGSFGIPKRSTALELLDASIRASGHTGLRSFILKSIVKPRAEITSLLSAYESKAALESDETLRSNAQFAAANPRAAERLRLVTKFKIYTL